jgi:hypothetical protein
MLLKAFEPNHKINLKRVIKINFKIALKKLLQQTFKKTFKTYQVDNVIIRAKEGKLSNF